MKEIRWSDVTFIAPSIKHRLAWLRSDAVEVYETISFESFFPKYNRVHLTSPE